MVAVIEMIGWIGPAPATIDGIGWIGAALLLVAYACISSERWRARSLKFQVCNAVGSACLIANTVYHEAYPSAVVNIVWMIIALNALRVLRSTKHSPGPAAPREE